MSAIIRPLRHNDPAVRLVVCHHAGGSGSVYFPLSRQLPDDWDVLLVDLPGRGTAHRATPLRDITEMAAHVTAAVLPWAGPPLALFGHSMGAVVALESARRLTERGVRPAWVGVSGRVAPETTGRTDPLDPRLSDEALLTALSAMGGIPQRLDEVPEFRQRFLRLVRGDLHALGAFRPAEERRKLDAPLTAFGATGDDLAPVATLHAWAAETTGPFRQHTFDGGHFHFLDDGFDRLGRAVVREVRSALGALSKSDPMTTDAHRRRPA
ncbi:thioesterase II family protein [Streptomyces sp. NPDC056486]|uniref:thioesterase II family protein n=1 Tax=Streptomyces sp. NPDC056486 TaxID=3345835 RepID=UPI0036C495A3